MARRTKAQILAGVKYVTAKVIANNTVEYVRDDGTRVIRLHRTDIVEFFPDGLIRVNSGGWRTPTTKNRLNEALHHWTIWQKGGQWFIAPHGEWDRSYHFHDGLLIKDDRCDGQPFDPKAAKKAALERRRVKAYAKKFIKALRRGEVSPPGSGDCFYCSMVTTDGDTLGESSERGSDSPQHHIRSHIEEDYFVGSLLWRAAETEGISPFATYCLAVAWGQVPDAKPDTTDSLNGPGWRQLQTALYKYCVKQIGYST